MRMTMKKIIWMQAVLLTGLAAMWGCGGDDTTDEQPAVMPQVTFPVTESAVSAYVDDAVRFEAVIESPGPLSCGWFVDGKLAASTASMTYVFKAKGTYDVRFEASNTAGKVGKDYSVTVEGSPLKVEFSNEEETVSCLPGEEVLITATVVAGDKEVVHEWKVGDEVVSTTAEFRHTFDAAGTYAVTYEGVNAKGEKKNASWTVEVSEDAVGYMFENFESRDALPGHFINGNAAIEGTTLQENPYKTAVNPSNKVLRDLLLKESGTSGYFDMGFSHLTDRSKYRAIRVKVYLGKNLYYPRMQINVLPDGKKNKLPSKINGQPFTSSMKEADWKALIKTDDWNVFVYDLIDCGYQNADGSAVTNFGGILRPCNSVRSRISPAAA